jgi:hypothetical protein
MTQWLLRQINASDEIATNLDSIGLAFHHPWMLLGLVLLVPLAAFVYLRQLYHLPSVPTFVRVLLSATRILILAIMVVILASPYLKLDLKSDRKPIVAFLFDHSQSMQLPASLESETELSQVAGAAGYHGAGGRLDAETRQALNRIPRIKLAQQVVQTSSASFLEPLSKKFDLQYYSFARDLTQLGVNAVKPEFPEAPNPGGPATHIGDAIGKVLDDAAGRPISGIIVFSDGQNNGGRSPLEAAKAARANKTPVFTVPVGTATRFKDIAIADVFTTGLVSKDDLARVTVTLESFGFDKTVKVLLKDGDKVLDTREITLHSTEQQQVDLTFKATEVGARYLTVHVPPEPEEKEFLRANNTETAFLRVSNEKLKVLLIDGVPRWDFRFLKNALRRDNGLEGLTDKAPVDVFLEAEWKNWTPDDQKKKLPRKLDQLEKYHTIILGDVSPKMLDKEFLEALDRAVRDKGVGLIVAAGPRSMPQNYDDRLLNLLPVRTTTKSEGRYPRGVPSFRVELAPEGVIHEATRFYDDPGRNQNTWNQMPRYYWCAATEKPAPGATVLAWNPQPGQGDKIPLIAHHYAGQGKVMFIGTDSTFLWRQNVGDRFFYKFWGQSLRFVARTDSKSGKKTRLEVRPVRAQPGENAQIEMMAFDGDGAPLTGPTQTVQVQGPGQGSSVTLHADPAVKGRYTGRYMPQNPGEYTVSFTGVGQTEPVTARLRVTVAPEEMRHPNVNRAALLQIAESSRLDSDDDSRSQMIELQDLASIAERLQGEARQTELKREATLWDNWMVLTLLVFLYSLDVGLRRLLGLS